MHPGSEAIGRSVGQQWAQIGRVKAVRTEIFIGPGVDEKPDQSCEQGARVGQPVAFML